MWFMGDDGLMHPVEDCTHGGHTESWSAEPRWMWCGLCGGVYR